MDGAQGGKQCGTSCDDAVFSQHTAAEHTNSAAEQQSHSRGGSDDAWCLCGLPKRDY